MNDLRIQRQIIWKTKFTQRMPIPKFKFLICHRTTNAQFFLINWHLTDVLKDTEIETN